MDLSDGALHLLSEEPNSSSSSPKGAESIEERVLALERTSLFRAPIVVNFRVLAMLTFNSLLFGILVSAVVLFFFGPDEFSPANPDAHWWSALGAIVVLSFALVTLNILGARTVEQARDEILRMGARVDRELKEARETFSAMDAQAREEIQRMEERVDQELEEAQERFTAMQADLSEKAEKSQVALERADWNTRSMSILFGLQTGREDDDWDVLLKDFFDDEHLSQIASEDMLARWSRNAWKGDYILPAIELRRKACKLFPESVTAKAYLANILLSRPFLDGIPVDRDPVARNPNIQEGKRILEKLSGPARDTDILLPLGERKGKNFVVNVFGSLGRLALWEQDWNAALAAFMEVTSHNEGPWGFRSLTIATLASGDWARAKRQISSWEEDPTKKWNTTRYAHHNVFRAFCRSFLFDRSPEYLEKEIQKDLPAVLSFSSYHRTSSPWLYKAIRGQLRQDPDGGKVGMTTYLLYYLFAGENDFDANRILSFGKIRKGLLSRVFGN